MDPAHLVEMSQQMLVLALKIMLPVLGIAAIVGLLVGWLSRPTQEECELSQAQRARDR